MNQTGIVIALILAATVGVITYAESFIKKSSNGKDKKHDKKGH